MAASILCRQDFLRFQFCTEPMEVVIRSVHSPDGCREMEHPPDAIQAYFGPSGAPRDGGCGDVGSGCGAGAAHPGADDGKRRARGRDRVRDAPAGGRGERGVPGGVVAGGVSRCSFFRGATLYQRTCGLVCVLCRWHTAAQLARVWICRQPPWGQWRWADCAGRARRS
jgi:predicted small metal-binding protein